MATRRTADPRSESIGTKVTKADYEMFRALAGNRAIGEWVREVLFKAAMSDPAAATQLAVLEEVVALRKVVVNLGFAMASGQPITLDQMQTLIADADAEKGEKARARLSAV